VAAVDITSEYFYFLFVERLTKMGGDSENDERANNVGIPTGVDKWPKLREIQLRAQAIAAFPYRHYYKHHKDEVHDLLAVLAYLAGIILLLVFLYTNDWSSSSSPKQEACEECMKPTMIMYTPIPPRASVLHPCENDDLIAVCNHDTNRCEYVCRYFKDHDDRDVGMLWTILYAIDTAIKKLYWMISYSHHPL